MNLLILCMQIGKTAPGIVYERLIDGLSKYHKITVVTSINYSDKEFGSNVKILVVPSKVIHPRLQALSVGVSYINPMDKIWSWKVQGALRKNQIDFDLIFTFMSYHNYGALIAGNDLKIKTNKRYFVYSVDAVPAPIGWNKNDLYYRGCKKMMRRYLQNVDGFFSSNNQMLLYQCHFIQLNEKCITDVIYTPAVFSNIDIASTPDELILCYTGGIYGKRNIYVLFEALSHILKKGVSFKFYFVGTNPKSIELTKVDPLLHSHLIFYPFMSDLSEIYAKSSILVDIDADIENDVFISSKLVSYIKVDRPILALSRKGSPSRTLFQNCQTVIFSNFNTESIIESIQYIVNNQVYFKYDNDRKRIRSTFQIESIIKKVNNHINY